MNPAAAGCGRERVRPKMPHKPPTTHTQPRQRVYEGGTRGALASTRLTTSLVTSRPIPTPHNGRPGS
jgi:hypothetical protein